MAPTPPDNPVSTLAMQQAFSDAFNTGEMNDSIAAAFRVAAQYWRDRAAYLEAARKKGWKGTGEMLVFAAKQAESMAGELENGETPTVTDPAAVQRCASFRRATDDDPAVCVRPRGHDGDHLGDVNGETVDWPRRHSGEQCNVAMTHDENVRCSLPLGHADGHQADDPSGVTWLWTYGVEPVRHDPADDPNTAEDDAAVEVVIGELDAAHADLFPGQCASTSTVGERMDRCMLPGGHTGNHISDRGTRWPQEHRAPAEPDPPRVRMETIEHRDDSGALVATERRGYMNSGAADTVTAVTAIPAQRTEEPASVDAANPFGPVQPAPPSAAVVPFRAPSIVVPLLPKAPVTEREYDSVSSIESMAGCGMKYRLKYHESAPELPAWWLVGGKAFHRVVEWVETRSAKGETVTGQDAANVWQTAFDHEIADTEQGTGVDCKHWKAAKGTKASGPENEQWWRTNGEAMSVRYLIGRRALIEDGWELLRSGGGDLALELEFRFPLGFAGRAIRGFIDSVWINRTKQMVLVVDDKSGARPAESTFQLETYAAAVATLLVGSDLSGWPVLGTYYNARKGEYSSRIRINTEAAAQVADARSAMTWQAERAGVFMPRVTNMCKGCGVAASCPVMALKASEPLEPVAAGTDVEAPEW